MTLRSTRAARMYEPGTWIARVSPTPLLMVVGLHDTITLTDLALGAYEAALQPKKLVTIDGGHFDPYLTRFARSERRRGRMVHRTPQHTRKPLNPKGIRHV